MTHRPSPAPTSLSVAARTLSVLVRAYQVVSAGRPSPCRYWPTCSTYALEALEAHGAVRGSWLAGRRLLRCHPWSRRSGVDPVPARVHPLRGPLGPRSPLRGPLGPGAAS